VWLVMSSHTRCAVTLPPAAPRTGLVSAIPEGHRIASASKWSLGNPGGVVGPHVRRRSALCLECKQKLE
jgi:hypothetical protein